MKLARMILAGAMLAAVPSVTLAQQPLTGVVTTIDRIQRDNRGSAGTKGHGRRERRRRN